MNDITSTDETTTTRGEFAELNRLRRSLRRLWKLPKFMHEWARRKIIHWNIPFTGTAGIDILEIEPEIVRIRLPNRRGVRNHIGGVHAAAIALAAETASGLALGMHIPDNRTPLLKTMAFRYTRPASGGIIAEARLTAKQIRELDETEKGEAKIEVQLWDDDNEKPVECVVVWAWVPKKKKKKKKFLFFG